MADQIIENGLRNRVNEIFGVEVCLFYPHRYAGAADLICEYEGKLSVVDFKNSNQLRSDQWNTDANPNNLKSLDLLSDSHNLRAL